MPVFLMLLFSLLLPAPPPPTAAVAFQRIAAATYQQAHRAARPTVAPATFPVKALNGQLVIPTAVGPQTFRNIIIDEKAVANGHSEEETETYTYHGFLPNYQRHVVEVAFYETAEWWLISPEGRRLTLYGAPLYAPDQQSIATICPGLEYSGGQPNAVQLLQVQQGVLRPVWEVRPENWEPAELFWVNSTTLYLKRTEYPKGQEGPTTYWKPSIAAKAH
ncbi:hypothetical protein HMJ29_01560 [Hymenobacter taeanensis]|uniref:GLPGLI family protein n=1 Tax=Hymenobacter taeanensis TaxID=2735321 RepID=A0A6M6BCK2_9BACT|nr:MULTISPECIES: hypothetical protein [Hymenobacter]QJX45692.1 hypothetical protein HMJ29_01560 [Hymenobacter taeanensis]UOQ79530.1 hypothetical protein MUN83_11765 [Hymenobacter sp. 5414T-23]